MLDISRSVGGACAEAETVSAPKHPTVNETVRLSFLFMIPCLSATTDPMPRNVRRQRRVDQARNDGGVSTG